MCTSGETSQNFMYAHRYQQIKKIGHGSFGTAYLVHDTKSKFETYDENKTYLILIEIHDEFSFFMFVRKVLKAIFIGDISENESSDAEHEALILVRLRHPNIVRFYDSFIDASYFCIVTEYCEVKFCF